MFFALVLSRRLSIVPINGEKGRRVQVYPSRVILNERRRGTRVCALSHPQEISIQNALRALVPQDYVPDAMNLTLRGRPEIAIFPPVFFSCSPPFTELLFTGVMWEKGK